MTAVFARVDFEDGSFPNGFFVDDLSLDTDEFGGTQKFLKFRATAIMPGSENAGYEQFNGDFSGLVFNEFNILFDSSATCDGVAQTWDD